MSILRIASEMTLNRKPFEDSLKAAGKYGETFAKDFNKMTAGRLGGLALASGVLALAKNLADTADRLGDLADQYETTIGNVEEIDRAAEKSGLAFEDLGKALDILAQKREEAVAGNEKLMATFNRLGISAEQLQNPMLKGVELAIRLNEAMQKSNRNERVARKELFGKGGARLGAALGEINTGALDNTDLETIGMEDVNSSWQKLKANFRLLRNKSFGLVGLAKMMGANAAQADGSALPLPEKIGAEERAAQAEEARLKRVGEIAALEEKIARARTEASERAMSDEQKRKQLEEKILALKTTDARLYQQQNRKLQLERELELAEAEADLAQMNARTRTAGRAATARENFGGITAQEAGTLALQQSIGLRSAQMQIERQQLNALVQMLQIQRQMLLQRRQTREAFAG